MGTKITDAGLKQLRKLTKLKRLNLLSTKITDDGLNELRRTPEPDVAQPATDEGPAEGCGPEGGQESLPQAQIVP